MKKFIAIILVIIFGFLCFYLGKAEDNNSEFFIRQGYEFKIPEGWKSNSQDIFTKENGISFPYIMVLSEDLKGRTDEQFFNYIKSEFKNQLLDYELIEEKNEGKYHIIKVRGEQQGQKMKFEIAFLKGLDDKYWYIVLNDDTDADNQKELQEIYKTFELR